MNPCQHQNNSKEQTQLPCDFRTKKVLNTIYRTRKHCDFLTKCIESNTIPNFVKISTKNKSQLGLSTYQVYKIERKNLENEFKNQTEKFTLENEFNSISQNLTLRQKTSLRENFFLMKLKLKIKKMINVEIINFNAW